MKKTVILVAALFSVVIGLAQTQSWSLDGNSGTSSSKFLGTTDNKPLIFKVNNVIAGTPGYEDNKYNVSFGYKSFRNHSTAGMGNVAVGAQALEYGMGAGNVAIGHWAMLYNSGQHNVAIGPSTLIEKADTIDFNIAIGSSALNKNRARGNVAVGYMSGANNSTASAITAIGHKALLHNTTGGQNTAAGFNALINNTTGYNNTAIGAWTMVSNTSGMYNTAVGMEALYANTTGKYNTALGEETLRQNKTGSSNVGLGSGALYSNTTGSINTAVGTSALWVNTTGKQNVAVGMEALAGNYDGNFNTAVGTRALWSTVNDPGAIHFGHGSNNTAVGFETLREITTGDSNVGMGLHALLATTTGKNNVAVGNKALVNNVEGTGNTAIGHGATAVKSNLRNSTAIGNGARVMLSDQIRLGNSSVSSIGGRVGWTTISDKRVSKNIKQKVPGLDFINLLQPVTYNIDLDAVDKISDQGGEGIGSRSYSTEERKSREAQQKIKYTGLIAQDVEKVAKEIGYDFSGIDSDGTETGLYGLRYSEFVVPLIQAVQELSLRNTNMDDKIQELEEINNSLLGQIAEIQTKLLLMSRFLFPGSEIEMTSYKKNYLEQNVPNPFINSTSIPYMIAEDFSDARIVLSDNSGRIVNQIPINDPGEGSVPVEMGSLGSGIYFYTLYVDKRMIDTKKMLKK